MGKKTGLSILPLKKELICNTKKYVLWLKRINKRIGSDVIQHNLGILEEKIVNRYDEV